MTTLRDIATTLAAQIAEIGPFELISDGTAIPVFAFAVKDPWRYTVFDVSNRLRRQGWQLPAYTMPEGAEDLAVLRVVVREGFSADLANLLLEHLREAVAHLAEHGAPIGDEDSHRFAHT